MSAKKIHSVTGNAALGAMLFKYFHLASGEKIPETPRITEELDGLETAIRHRCCMFSPNYPPEP